MKRYFLCYNVGQERTKEVTKAEYEAAVSDPTVESRVESGDWELEATTQEKH